MTQLAERGRVERGGRHAAMTQVGKASRHLPGRLVRERHHEDVARPDDAGRKCVRDAPGDDPGLAAPGARQDRQRPRRDRDRFALGWIEVGQEVVGVADWHPAIVAACPSPPITGYAPAMELRGRSVTIRSPTADDAAVLAAILAEPAVAAWWGAFDLERIRRDLLAGDAGEEPFVIEHEGEVVGYLQIVEEDDPDFRHAGVDLFIRTDRQGRGIGPDAIRTIAAHLFDDRGHHRLTIDPAADNIRAITAYAKVGFRPVGRLRRYQRMPDGRWVDGLLMELLAEELVR